MTRIVLRPPFAHDPGCCPIIFSGFANAAWLSGIPLIAADRDERVFRPGEIKTRSFRIADDMTIIGYCFSPQIQSVIPIAAERRNPQLLILESPELSICE
jgi:hypothetical protein